MHHAEAIGLANGGCDTIHASAQPAEPSGACVPSR